MPSQDSKRLSQDLEWAVSSPFLMEWGGGTLPEARRLEIDPSASFYGGYRVGYYFESLLRYWLEDIRGVEMLASGFQIIENGRTLGELDFVFRDENGKVNHWEVSSKFYLYTPGFRVLDSHFVGPNAGDTFERKFEKLWRHQLPMSESTFPDVECRAAFVKGRIFYHPESPAPSELPEGMSPNHLRGFWVRESEVTEFIGDAAARRFRILNKPHWLAAESGDGGLDAGELVEALSGHFRSSENPLLVSVLDGGSEVERGFVVSDRWPD